MSKLLKNFLADPTLVKSGSLVDGKWRTSENSFPVLNPFDQSVLANISEANSKVTDAAIESAYQAQRHWKTIPALKRSNLLKKWFELILKNKQDLATIMTLEQGKPLEESLGEIEYGASYIEWFAEEAKRMDGAIIPPLTNHHQIQVIKQPVGVVSAITPWNFPNSMITRKVAPALAAGCSIVVKPSELTPLSAIALAELALRAGIPNGVFNLVVGTDAISIGKSLTEHPKISKFSFTGSTQVGKLLMAQCASTVKKVSLELGGNAPFIVFEDANMELAVEGALKAKFRNAGQTCVCANRILVQDKIYDEFLNRFNQKVRDLKFGNGLADGTTIGPLIDAKAINRLRSNVELSISQGATLEVGMLPEPDQNHFHPIVLSEVENQMPIAQEEIFGPVAPILKFTSEQEALEIANDTNYGLASYFYTNDLGRIKRVSEALEFGMIGINEPIISNAAAPFGGIKQSGIGREGSKIGIDEFIEYKYVNLNFSE